MELEKKCIMKDCDQDVYKHFHLCLNHLKKYRKNNAHKEKY